MVTQECAFPTGQQKLHFKSAKYRVELSCYMEDSYGRLEPSQYTYYFDSLHDLPELIKQFRNKNFYQNTRHNVKIYKGNIHIFHSKKVLTNPVSFSRYLKLFNLN